MKYEQYDGKASVSRFHNSGDCGCESREPRGLEDECRLIWVERRIEETLHSCHIDAAIFGKGVVSADDERTECQKCGDKCSETRIANRRCGWRSGMCLQRNYVSGQPQLRLPRLTRTRLLLILYATHFDEYASRRNNWGETDAKLLFAEVKRLTHGVAQGRIVASCWTCNATSSSTAVAVVGSRLIADRPQERTLL